MALHFTKNDLQKCEYENLMRLAKVLGLKLGEHPAPGKLAAAVAQELQKQGGPKPR
jgi:hypothetical protein